MRSKSISPGMRPRDTPPGAIRALLAAFAALWFAAAPAAAATAAPPPRSLLEKMWAVPGFPDGDKVPWLELPVVRAKHGIICAGAPGENGHQHHPSICFFDGRYIVA